MTGLLNRVQGRGPKGIRVLLAIGLLLLPVALLLLAWLARNSLQPGMSDTTLGLLLPVCVALVAAGITIGGRLLEPDPWRFERLLAG